MISDNVDMRLAIDKALVACDTALLEVSLIPAEVVRQYYIPILSQTRLTSLGGIQPNEIRLTNLGVIGFFPASSSNPASITVKRGDDLMVFTPATAKAFTNWLYDAEVDNDLTLVSFVKSGNIAELLQGDVQIIVAGGSGYMDMFYHYAVVEKSTSQVSEMVVSQAVRVAQQQLQVDLTRATSPVVEY